MSTSTQPTADGPTARNPVARFWPLVAGLGAVVLALLLGALIFFRENNLPFRLDLAWMDEMIEHRAAFWTGLALVFNSLGGGLIAIIVVPVGVIAALLIYRRWWAALYFTIAVALSSVVVQVLKAAFGRPRPPDMLVSPDFGSFPSGHSANAAVIAVTMGIIFMRGWVWAAGAIYTVGMMLSRTYLGAHWISDTVGGLLVGAGIALVVWAPFADKLLRERLAPHSPVWKKLPTTSAP